MSITLPGDLIQEPDVEQTAYLVHNLWNYEISVGFCSTGCPDAAFHFELNRTRDLSVATSSEAVEVTEDDLLPSFYLGFGNHVRVYCPNAAVTSPSRYAPAACQRSQGDWVEFRRGWEKVELGKVTYDQFGSSATLVFPRLNAMPTNFLDPPRLYWFSWGKRTSMSALLITGIVFMCLFAVELGIIVFVVIAECC
jgi:hypothetical protein